MAFNSAERSRAARLRKKRSAGRPLSKNDRTWLRRYEGVIKAGTRKKGSATKPERDKAYRLRRKRRNGKTLSKTQDTWLRRYTRDRRVNKVSRAKASPSTTARIDAERIVRAISDWLTPGMTDLAPIVINSQRAPRSGSPGIATATLQVSADEFIVPATLTEPDLTRETLAMPPSTGRRAALRVQIASEDREPQWVSVTALDADWYETAGDALNSVNGIMTAYQVEGIAGWSVIVS